MSLSFILASSAEKSRDETKKENEALFAELEALQREYKRARQVVEQLTREYEESKDYDPVRRYEKLKGMVKRTILHFKLNSEEQVSGQGAAQGGRDYMHQLESMKRREEKNTNVTKQELLEENQLMQEQIKDYKRKFSILHDLVGQLEKHYEGSKRYAMMQRYRMLKGMIKNVIYDKLI